MLPVPGVHAPLVGQEVVLADERCAARVTLSTAAVSLANVLRDERLRGEARRAVRACVRARGVHAHHVSADLARCRVLVVAGGTREAVAEDTHALPGGVSVDGLAVEAQRPRGGK